ncbi:MAG: hypothetical protein MI919_26460 [Holophagales bacterium]|nr:hypothetical protein [Holophagales bacterium]
MSPKADPSPEGPHPQAAPGQLLHSLRWPLTLVILAALGLAAYLLTLERAADTARAVGDSAGAAAGAAVRGIQRAAEGFFTGDVTERFVSEMPRVDRSGQGRLEVARLEIVETLSRSDERRMFWDTLPLGTTTVEVQVPVTYRYHVRLDDPWRIEVRGPVCLVEAPELRPSLPPAIHTARMRTRAEEGWLRFDASERMEELRRSLTPRLEQRAKSHHHESLVRDEARRAVESFVRQWLLRQEFWAEDRFATVRARFADEAPAAPADPVPPQLELGETPGKGAPQAGAGQDSAAGNGSAVEGGPGG